MLSEALFTCFCVFIWMSIFGLKNSLSFLPPGASCCAQQQYSVTFGSVLKNFIRVTMWLNIPTGCFHPAHVCVSLFFLLSFSVSVFSFISVFVINVLFHLCFCVLFLKFDNFKKWINNFNKSKVSLSGRLEDFCCVSVWGYKCSWRGTNMAVCRISSNISSSLVIEAWL